MNYQIQFNRAAINKLIKGQMEELSINELLSLLEANPQVMNLIRDESVYRDASRKQCLEIIKKYKLKLVYEIVEEGGYKYYELGLRLNGRFENLYYAYSDDYDFFSKIVPYGLSEAMEGIYEYSGNEDDAQKYLESFGYRKFQEEKSANANKGGIRGGKVYNKQGKVIGLQG